MVVSLYGSPGGLALPCRRMQNHPFGRACALPPSRRAESAIQGVSLVVMIAHSPAQNKQRFWGVEVSRTGRGGRGDAVGRRETIDVRRECGAMRLRQCLARLTSRVSRHRSYLGSPHLAAVAGRPPYHGSPHLAAVAGRPPYHGSPHRGSPGPPAMESTIGRIIGCETPSPASEMSSTLRLPSGRRGPRQMPS